MNIKKQIYKHGYITTVNESGKKIVTKFAQSDSQNRINKCLNCTKPKCNGNCIEIRRTK